SRFPGSHPHSRRRRKFATATHTPDSAMPSYTTIKVESDGALAVVTLNRPEKRNAISATMIAELMAALQDVESGSERVAIITGAGKAFCAGVELGDLKSL